MMTKYQQGMAEYSARMLEDHLNEMNDVIGNNDETLRLLKDPETILQIKDETLRRTAGMIYVCAQALMFTEYDITYHSGGVQLKLFTNKNHDYEKEGRSEHDREPRD